MRVSSFKYCHRTVVCILESNIHRNTVTQTEHFTSNSQTAPALGRREALILDFAYQEIFRRISIGLTYLNTR